MRLRAPLAGSLAALGGVVACGAFTSDGGGSPPAVVPEAAAPVDGSSAGDAGAPDGDAGCARGDAGWCAPKLLVSGDVVEVAASEKHLAWRTTDKTARFCLLPACSAVVWQQGSVDAIAITDKRYCVRSGPVLRCVEHAAPAAAPLELPLTGALALRGFRGALYFTETDKVRKLDDGSPAPADVSKGLPGGPERGFDLRPNGAGGLTVFFVQKDNKIGYFDYAGVPVNSAGDIADVKGTSFFGVAAIDSKSGLVATEGGIYLFNKGPTKEAKLTDRVADGLASSVDIPNMAYAVVGGDVVEYDGDKSVVTIGVVSGASCVAASTAGVFVGNRDGLYRLLK